MFRIVVLVSLFLFVGCGLFEDSESTDPKTFTGQFNLIVQGVDDMVQDVNREDYRGLNEPVEDQLNNTVYRWVKSLEGESLEADAKAFQAKLSEVTAAYDSDGDGGLEELRSRVQEAKDLLEGLKEKL
jgi:hypothetical protein